MTRFSLRRLATLVSVFSASVAVAPAGAQGYFGRNKVQYETFNWRILKTEHFDNFFLSGGVAARRTTPGGWPSAGTRGTRRLSATPLTGSR